MKFKQRCIQISAVAFSELTAALDDIFSEDFFEDV